MSTIAKSINCEINNKQKKEKRLKKQRNYLELFECRRKEKERQREREKKEEKKTSLNCATGKCDALFLSIFPIST